MIFVETPLFTRQVLELLDDEAYAELQRGLVRNPEAGVVIKDTGGIWKIRVAAKGHGKSGGGRVIYYHFVSETRIALLMAYPKNSRMTCQPMSARRCAPSSKSGETRHEQIL